MIPLHRPVLAGDEAANAAEVLGSGATRAGGSWSERAGSLLSDALDGRPVLLTTSCTAALELAALVLDVRPGDTVVLPSYTFPTTASAFLRAGASVRFADIEATRLGLDPASVAERMDDSVVAVVPVHYAGVACDVDGLLAVLDRWPRARLVEDAAHGLFGSHRGRPLGALGTIGVVSFHETKTFSCGEGGAIVLGPDVDVDRAWTLWDKGTDRRAFLAGRTEAYTWQEVGTSSGMSEVLAAVLVAQLRKGTTWLAHRRRAIAHYLDRLAPAVADHGVTLFPDLAEEASAAHLFPLLLPPGVDRAGVIADLAATRVASAFHFTPLHTSPAGRRADPAADAPVTADVACRLLRLPLDSVVTDEEVERSAAALLASLRSRR